MKEGHAFILLLVYPARLVFLWPVVMPGWHLIRLMLMRIFCPPGVPPRRLRDIQVAGKLSPFNWTLDGAKEEIGYVKLKVTAEGETVKAKKRGPNLQGIVDGELSSPLLFKTTFKKTDGLTWQLTILDLTKQPENLQSAEAVYFLAGQGRPPLYLLWDGKDEAKKTQLLKEGHRYGASMTL